MNMWSVNVGHVPWTVVTITFVDVLRIRGATPTFQKRLKFLKKIQNNAGLLPSPVVLYVLQEVANFMDIIKELWYGNVAPFEQCTRGDKQMKELLSLMARNRDELGEGLTEKQKETLEKFEEALNEMHSIAERDAFSYGLRLGIRLMAEAFLQPLCED